MASCKQVSNIDDTLLQPVPALTTVQLSMIMVNALLQQRQTLAVVCSRYECGKPLRHSGARSTDGLDLVWWVQVHSLQVTRTGEDSDLSMQQGKRPRALWTAILSCPARSVLLRKIGTCDAEVPVVCNGIVRKHIKPISIGIPTVCMQLGRWTASVG